MGAVAVLIDGDNLSGKHAARIVEVAAALGRPTVQRVYVDAQRPCDWHAARGFRLMHAGTGKNASDLLLALDAVELALRGDADQFVIASSDRDFTHLALRLREYGASVTGVGEAKTPQSFRAACADFIVIGSQRVASLPTPLPKEAQGELDRKIGALMAEQGCVSEGMRIATLGPLMHARHGTRISTFLERTWRAYLAARPELYALDPRGPEARVRLRLGKIGGAA
ncbi:NYN domain-containing protein [Cereibacter azotoformans]|uniref:NYN domain-containing protein n=1 Tax=Cereibacter azotoformans TaxID=43057 RepID=A0A2T5JSL3_9RHOB|nr:NYN domain-containing protein [Cereibacter azotoformans]AXQ95465.1 NYN domain-containing protein [Cereibacter sphaeroides]PTR11590.1 NYN domain-containing protein [Cereibacter azotoformans]UIJ32296.1 NYN domain-containing protein [Cereibacter azotoformans]